MARSNSFLPILAALAVLLAACGPNADDDAGDAAGGAPDGAAPTGSSMTGELEASGEIFVYGYSYENGDEIATTRVDHFTEQFPDIDVTYSESTFAPQELLTALQGSDPPDVIRMPRNVIGSYIQRGVFEPIDSCLGRAGVDPTGYRDAAIQQLTIDGTLYALPEAFAVRAWLIDNVLFEEAGLDPATFDWSDWDAIREANTTILESTDAKVGIDAKVSDPLTADMFPLWVAANGGQLVADDGTPQLNSPEAVEALEFVASMVEPYGSHADFLDARGQTGDFFGAENQFALHLEGAFPMQQFYLNTCASPRRSTSQRRRSRRVMANRSRGPTGTHRDHGRQRQQGCGLRVRDDDPVHRRVGRGGRGASGTGRVRGRPESRNRVPATSRPTRSSSARSWTCPSTRSSRMPSCLPQRPGHRLRDPTVTGRGGDPAGMGNRHDRPERKRRRPVGARPGAGGRRGRSRAGRRLSRGEAPWHRRGGHPGSSG